MSEKNGILPSKSAADAATVLLDLMRPILAQRQFAAASVEFLSLAAAQFGCDRASLGFVDGSHIKLCAVSRHYQEIDLPGLAEVTAAMEESLLQDTILIYPQASSEFPHIVVAHADLVRRNDLSSALTVPLACDGKLIGALTFENSKSGTFAPEQLWIAEKLATDVGPLLHLKWQISRPFWHRSLSFMRSLVWGESNPRSRRLRWAVIAAALCGVFALFVLPVTTQISGKARLEGLVQRAISVPFDGYLKEVHVRPGERVKHRQVLAVLDPEALLTQQRKIEAEIAQQENALAESMVKADRTQVAIRASKMDELNAQRDLISTQVEQTRLLAPFDGVVIKGDLVQLLGSPLKRSDILLTLSEGDEFRVIAEIAEQDIGDIKIGQQGVLVLAALPSESFKVRVARITPVAGVTPDGQNAFEVEAAIDAQNPVLTPGLKGVVKFDVGQSPPGWRWLIRAWHSIYYAIWSRLG